MSQVPPVSPDPRPSGASGCLKGALAVLVLAASVGGVAFFLYDRAQKQAIEAQTEAARSVFAPVFDKMDEAAAQPQYDIDKTIRVLHETDRMLKDSKSLPEYLQWAATQDYTGVAPEALKARRQVLEIVMRLYASQVAEEDQAELSRFSAETLLQVASMVGVEGEAGVGISGSFSVDKEQAARVLRQVQEERIERARLRKAVRKAENDLLEALVRYAGTWSTYLKEWDHLCLLRDQAYLAASIEDWDAVAAASREAIALAPHEKEAHLLLALALVEGGPQVLPEVDVMELLDGYMKEHPDATAPALLLLGAEQARRKDLKAAGLSFMQSAAYYPKQSQALSDLFDPYQARSFLRATREGSYVLRLYQATMMGAGHFSPDLRMASLAFQAGDGALGRKKLLEHFYRRRAEGAWDHVLEDIRYCLKEFGAEFVAIFPAESYLDLVVKPGLMGLSDNLSLAVRNRSDVTLHNATLLLCVNFNDMYPDDYEVIVGGPTQAAVLAHEETSFGDVPIEVEVLGKKRTRKDVYRTRAILVSNEAVTWVDTEEYRISEAREFRDGAVPRVDATPVRTVPGILDHIRQGSTLQVEPSRFGKDDVVIGLPRELVTLSPLFDLKVGDTTIQPDLNNLALDDGRIRLEFKNAFAASETGEQPTLTLKARTPWGRELRIRWEPAGAGQYGPPRIEDVSVELGDRVPE